MAARRRLSSFALTRPMSSVAARGAPVRPSSVAMAARSCVDVCGFFSVAASGSTARPSGTRGSSSAVAAPRASSRVARAWIRDELEDDRHLVGRAGAGERVERCYRRERALAQRGDDRRCAPRRAELAEHPRGARSDGRRDGAIEEGGELRRRRARLRRRARRGRACARPPAVASSCVRALSRARGRPPECRCARARRARTAGSPGLRSRASGAIGRRRRARGGGRAPRAPRSSLRGRCRAVRGAAPAWRACRRARRAHERRPGGRRGRSPAPFRRAARPRVNRRAEPARVLPAPVRSASRRRASPRAARRLPGARRAERVRTREAHLRIRVAERASERLDRARVRHRLCDLAGGDAQPRLALAEPRDGDVGRGVHAEADGRLRRSESDLRVGVGERLEDERRRRASHRGSRGRARRLSGSSGPATRARARCARARPARPARPRGRSRPAEDEERGSYETAHAQDIRTPWTRRHPGSAARSAPERPLRPCLQPLTSAGRRRAAQTSVTRDRRGRRTDGWIVPPGRKNSSIWRSAAAFTRTPSWTSFSPSGEGVAYALCRCRSRTA